jgi:chromosome segregation ATPase
MTKRKGAAIADAPHTAIVKDMTRLSLTPNSKQKNVVFQEEWQSTLDRMTDLMEAYQNSSVLQTVERCLVVNAQMEEKVDDSMQTAAENKNRIKKEIEVAEEACRNESNDLQRHERQLRNTDAEIEAFRQMIAEMEEKKRISFLRSQGYRDEAAEEIEHIDQVEMERMKEVPRIKHQISLYGTMTGIKWDFSREDVLAGEVVRFSCFSVHRYFLLY